ncbi:MAG TPA: hypothetical protein DCP28_19025, partial [Cytophagales bacterium]|nr:hypothetical protein [Cytophagales bacterium]
MGAKAAAVGAQLIAQRKETFTNSSSRSASEGTRLPILRQLHQHQEKPSSSETLAKEGLPAQLKAGIENLSGRPMDDVKVHYNSDKPAQLQAHAYAQGTDIHLAPGQEKHLPH